MTLDPLLWKSYLINAPSLETVTRKKNTQVLSCTCVMPQTQTDKQRHGHLSPWHAHTDRHAQS